MASWSNIIIPLHTVQKSPQTLGPKIWNQFLGNVKSETSYTKFKDYIDTYFGPKQSCNVCMNICNSISVKCVLKLTGGLPFILMFLLIF